MSRAHEITWIPLKRNVSTKDKLELQISLLDILDPGDMRKILREELGETLKRKGVTLSDDATTVTIEASGEKVVSARGETKEHAEEELKRALERGKAQIEAELAKEIAALETDVRPEVDAAIQRTYVRALKTKAAKLGEVQSVTESAGEIVIKVKT